MRQHRQRYTVVNTRGDYLVNDNLLLLPEWTPDIRQLWLTTSKVEAARVANQVGGRACAITLEPLPVETHHAVRGIPVSVQQQVITLHEQGLSYREIARLLSIAKSTVGNIVNRH